MKGKTTLLNVLNFRNRGKLKIEGEIRINGALVRSSEAISSLSGYVQQDVIRSPLLDSSLALFKTLVSFRTCSSDR